MKWSQRDNNNYQQTGLLVSLHYVAANRAEFLRNFYLKSKRSVEKPQAEGPAAYVFPADDPRPGAQAELLRLLQLQGCEIHRATAPFTAVVSSPKKPKKDEDKTDAKTAEKDKAAAARKADAKDEKPAPRDARVPRRQLPRAHGPAVQPDRRRDARLPVLEPR